MKSIDAAIFIFPFYPDFKPPSPENPSRPLRVSQVLKSRAVITIVLIKADKSEFELRQLRYRAVFTCVTIRTALCTHWVRALVR